MNDRDIARQARKIIREVAADLQCRPFDPTALGRRLQDAAALLENGNIHRHSSEDFASQGGY